jgi:hypothetical protein
MFATEEYEFHKFTVKQFRAELKKVQDEASGEELRPRLAAVGAAPDDVRSIETEKSGEGLTGLETVLINFATAAALKAFELVVLPEIRDRLKARRPEDVRKRSKRGGSKHGGTP